MGAGVTFAVRARHRPHVGIWRPFVSWSTPGTLLLNYVQISPTGGCQVIRRRTFVLANGPGLCGQPAALVTPWVNPGTDMNALHPGGPTPPAGTLALGQAYEVRADQLSGSPLDMAGMSPLGQWLSLTSVREWAYAWGTSLRGVSGTLRVSLRYAGTTTTLTQGDYLLEG